jgi:hypothetical protein
MSTPAHLSSPVQRFAGRDLEREIDPHLESEKVGLLV